MSLFLDSSRPPSSIRLPYIGRIDISKCSNVKADGSKCLGSGYMFGTRFYCLSCDKGTCMNCDNHDSDTLFWCKQCRPESCFKCSCTMFEIDEHSDESHFYWSCSDCGQIYPHFDDIKEPDY